MYPSSFNSSNQPRTCFYFENNDTNQYSKPPSSSIHIHSPHFEEETSFCELFQQQQQPISNALLVAHEHPSHETYNTSTVQSSAMENCSRSNGKLIVKKDAHVELRKRSWKKDRHSKINTARGPRDRRMRLSLDVAKKFFKLQDMLGFDKASKTVEWLLMKSKTAIQQLLPEPQQQSNRSSSFLGVSNSASSTSECEVLSGIDDQLTTKCSSCSSSSKSKSKEKKKKLIGGARKTGNLHHPLTKETREKARARARERTMEKNNYNKLVGCSDDQYPKHRPCSSDQAMDQLGSWSLFGENQVQTIHQPENSSSYFQIKQAILGDHPLFMTGTWSPSFNCQNNTELSQEQYQFNDFQVLSNLWEDNN